MISCQPKGLSRVSSKNHSSKASILWHSAFFMAHISQSYMTTGKTTALTRWTFVGKVMSLLFNMMSRFLISFLPRSLMKFYDSQDKTILQNVYIKTRAPFCTQTNYDISLKPRSINGNPQNCNFKSHSWSEHTAQLGLQVAFNEGIPSAI